MADSMHTHNELSLAESRLRFLDRQIVRQIDQALCRIGEFGEVRLIVVKGQLRFIQTMQSTNIRNAGDQEMLP